MDEIEFKQAYNEACTAAERIAAPETKTAMMQVLQLINGMMEMIEEMQVEEDE